MNFSNYYSDEAYDYINNNNNKKFEKEDIKLNNYTWKSLYCIMNRIKNIWFIKNFNYELKSEIKNLNNSLYSNLYKSNNLNVFNPKNSILKNEINSLFHNTLFDFLYEEQELYEYYDNKFNSNNYQPRNLNKPFKSFIIYFKNLYLDINSNNNKLDSFKKIRWYIFDENKSILNIKNDLFKSSILMMDIEEENETNNYLNNDESINNYNKNNLCFNDYESNESEIDNIIEKNENIIDDKFIDKLLLNEDNPLLYIIKLIYLSISSYCKETICYLLTTYNDDNTMLINNYTKRFDNFIESAKQINSQCENINISVNYLYKYLFTNYTNFPKFSIFRLCIKIWYKESSSFLVQNNNITLLNKIKNSIINLYSDIIKYDINTIKNFSFISNSNNEFFNKKEKLSLCSSICIFNSENISNDNNYSKFIPFGSLYDDNNSKYYIIEKGLKIIYDSFSNEFNVNLFNLSYIDVNNYYNDIENSFLNLIKENIMNSFELNIIEKNIPLKLFIEHILSIFKDYFYENRIIPKFQIQIFQLVHNILKQNIFNYLIHLFNNKFLNKSMTKDNSFNMISSYGISQNTNYSSYIETDFTINNLSNNNDINSLEEIKKYIIKHNNINVNDNDIITKINNFMEEINKNEKLEELLNNLNNWKNQYMNNIMKKDKKVKKELDKKNLTNKFNNLQRQLFSFSIESDWEFIEKVNSIEKDNINQNKSNILDLFNDFKSLNDLNNLEPFYKESINNDSKNNNNKIKDIDIGKSFFNFDVNNNFGDNNEEDINPFNIKNDDKNNLNNYDIDNLNNWNNLQNSNYCFDNNYNNNDYNLNDLNPFNDFNKDWK